MDESGLRLATWNIHKAVGLDGRRDIERIAKVIRQMTPDLIGLQEVDNRIDSEGDDIGRLEFLTGMKAVAGPTMLRDAGDFGNVLLTRLPVVDVERFDISVSRREPRGILIVHIDWLGERVQFAVTHLGLQPGERRTQVRQLIECLSRGDRSPLVLMGDFNEWLFWGRPMLWLHRHFGYFRTRATFPSYFPLLHLDHILSDPPERLRVKSVFKSELSRIASDHLPLSARLIK